MLVCAVAQQCTHMDFVGCWHFYNLAVMDSHSGDPFLTGASGDLSDSPTFGDVRFSGEVGAYVYEHDEGRQCVEWTCRVKMRWRYDIPETLEFRIFELFPSLQERLLLLHYFGFICDGQSIPLSAVIWLFSFMKSLLVNTGIKHFTFKNICLMVSSILVWSILHFYRFSGHV